MFFILTVLGLSGLAVMLNYWYRKPFVEDIAKKSVFITGTDTGFGRQLALDLDRKGLKVYAGCYTEEGAASLRKEAASERIHILQIDVSDLKSIQRAKEIVQKDLSPDRGLWGLVNNAGIARSLIFGLSSIEDFRQVMEVNFFGVVNVTEAFSPLIKKSHGRIVNIISILGRFSGVAEPYVCSKFALQPYTDGLRRWMRAYGVHVAAIEPGYFRTNITKGSFLEDDLQKSWDKLPQHLKEEYGEGLVKQAKKDMLTALHYNPVRWMNRVNFVTGAITHALLAKHPKDRYVIGYDANTYFRLFAFLPDWVTDFFLLQMCSFYSVLKKQNQGRMQFTNGYIRQPCTFPQAVLKLMGDIASRVKRETTVGLRS